MENLGKTEMMEMERKAAGAKEQVMELRQKELKDRFPIWFSSVDQRRLNDPLNALAAVECAQAQMITVRAVDYAGENELERFLTRCTVDCSKFGGGAKENILRVEEVLTNQDPEYKVWAVVVHSMNHIELKLVERKAPWAHDETVEIFWDKESYVHLELVMRPGTNVAEVERMLALIRCIDDSPLHRKVIVMEYTRGLGYWVDSYYPEMNPYKWIDPSGFARLKTPVDPTYPWKS